MMWYNLPVKSIQEFAGYRQQTAKERTMKSTSRDDPSDQPPNSLITVHF